MNEATITMMNKGDSHKNPCKDFLGQLGITTAELNSKQVTTLYLGSKANN